MSIEDRAAGAVMGALIGDALGVGPHWYYDLEEMRRDFGNWITGLWRLTIPAGDDVKGEITFLHELRQFIGQERIKRFTGYEQSQYAAVCRRHRDNGFISLSEETIRVYRLRRVRESLRVPRSEHQSAFGRFRGVGVTAGFLP